MSFPDSLSRRKFLLGCSTGVAAIGLISHYGVIGFERSRLHKNSFDEVFLTAHKNEKEHFVSGISLQGEETFRLETISACHSIVTHAQRSDIAVGISRDPEISAIVFDPHNGKKRALCHTPVGRHFNGHGFISDDGQYLFASQNDFRHSRGVIAVYHLDTGQHVREFDSYGVGPHDLVMLNDGQTLVVANGGIQTHPDSGRKPLNIPQMRPNLSYIDSVSGALIQSFKPSDPLLSFRHLAVGSDNVVGIAMQYQGERESPPVVGFQQGTQDIRMAKANSEMIHWKMNQYTASVCIHPETGIAAITCPRGNLVTFWDSRKAQYLSEIEVSDASGVSLDKTGETFLITSGTGDLYHINASSLALVRQRLPKWEHAHWGNHLSHLSV